MEKNKKFINKKKICFVASGSAGHILPCLTLAKNYYKNSDSQAIFFTSSDALNSTVINKSPYLQKVFTLSLHKIPHKSYWQWIPYLYSLLKTFFTALIILKTEQPGKIISTGGYLSVPVCIAAKILKIPLELWELNVVPGKTIYFLSRWANSINICFQETQSYLFPLNCALQKYPLRFDNNIDDSAENITKKLPVTFLILGGSQGSIFINTIVKEWLLTIPSSYHLFTIVHQTGIDSLDSLKNFYKEYAINATVFDYQEDMIHHYKKATFIISRAGAGSLFEILFFNKKCITIPLQTPSSDHQYANAQAFSTQYPETFCMLTQSAIINNPALFHKVLNTVIEQATEKA